MQAHVEIRSQHSVGSSSKMFGGPDTYVTVQVVPDGTERLKCLNHKVARKRKIKLIYCGEGYSNRCTSPKSMLNRAIFEAEEIADCINTLDKFGVEPKFYE